MTDLEKRDNALRTIYRVLGPTAPECCAGCRAEIETALEVVRASGVDVSEIDDRIERRKAKAAIDQ